MQVHDAARRTDDQQEAVLRGAPAPGANGTPANSAGARRIITSLLEFPTATLTWPFFPKVQKMFFFFRNPGLKFLRPGFRKTYDLGIWNLFFLAFVLGY